MKLNIKRFASSGDEEIFVDYSYDYTPNGYIRTVTAIITCYYDISSVFLVQDENEIDDTKNWIITEDSSGRSCAKRYFHKSFSAAYNIYCENNETPFSVNVNIVNDFQPESEQFPVEINGDVRIANTEMKLKDIVNSIHSIVDVIYPVGSVYISTTTANPRDLFGGTWEQIATGRTLWGASNDNELNTTVNSGLPNITGTYDPRWKDDSGGGIIMAAQNSGAMYTSRPNDHGYWWANVTTRGGAGSNTQYHTRLNFSAQRSNSIYGNSTIDQPPAYKVYMWRRTT